MRFCRSINFIILLISTFAQAGIKQIEPQALFKLMEKQQVPLIIDVRSKDEFKQGHLQGAINIPYDSLFEYKQLDAYKAQEIIVYCRSGRRAQVASNVLQDKGFNKLADLNGHLLLWQKLKYPLYK